jgi:hypothetical protein
MMISTWKPVHFCFLLVSILHAVLLRQSLHTLSTINSGEHDHDTTCIPRTLIASFQPQPLSGRHQVGADAIFRAAFDFDHSVPGTNPVRRALWLSLG